MRKKNRLKGSWKFLFGSISAAGAAVSIAEYIGDTGLMGNMTVPPFVYLLLAVGCTAFLLRLICPSIILRIQAMIPSNRFRQLHSEIEREWTNIKNDHENRLLGIGRTRGDIFRDRVRLSRKLSKLRIHAPEPDNDEYWSPFVLELSLLCEEGLLSEARRLYGDPNQFQYASN